MTKNRRVMFAAFAGYSVLTFALTYPITWHLGTGVPHDLGDPLLSTVILWWNAHHLPLTAAWWNGSFFWPSPGTLAFSDHRIGASLLASPLQWAGFSPLTAYNVTLLVTFPLCATSAHWLAYTLTGRHDASVVAGLAYGFSPYRIAHIEHLELLAAFGMPAALAALHQHLKDGRTKWIIVFGGALLLQALSCSYYFLFFLVMLALWMAWFLRWPWGRTPYQIAAAVATVVAVMSPIALRYLAIHKHYGLARGFGDIITLSADVTSIVTASPLSLVWGWTSTLNGPERQVFPGLTIVVVTAIAVMTGVRSEKARLRENRVSLVLVGLGSVFALIALSAWDSVQTVLPGVFLVARCHRRLIVGASRVLATVDVCLLCPDVGRVVHLQPWTEASISRSTVSLSTALLLVDASEHLRRQRTRAGAVRHACDPGVVGRSRSGLRPAGSATGFKSGQRAQSRHHRCLCDRRCDSGGLVVAPSAGACAPTRLAAGRIDCQRRVVR